MPVIAAVRAAVREDVATPARWPLLDGVRGVAVAAVVVYHAVNLGLIGRYGGDPVPAVYWPIGAGRIALDVFFVMSGFLVVTSWQSLRRRHGRPLPAAADYIRRRGLRILPLWWFSLVLMLPLFAPHLLRRGGDLVSLLTLQHHVLGGAHEQVNTVGWSLTTEWHFYLLVPLVVLAMRVFGPWPTLAACLAVSLWWHLGGRGDLPANLIVGRIDQFVAGAVAAGLVRAHDRGRPTALTRLLLRPWAGWLVGCALALVALAHASRIGRWERGIDSFTHPVIGLLVAALMVRWLCQGGVRLLNLAPFRALGLVSYSLYLWHYPLHRWVAHDLGMGGADVPVAATLGAMAAVSAAAVAFAFCTYALVERRFLTRTSSHTAVAAPAEGSPVDQPEVDGPHAEREPAAAVA